MSIREWSVAYPRERGVARRLVPCAARTLERRMETRIVSMVVSLSLIDLCQYVKKIGAMVQFNHGSLPRSVPRLYAVCSLLLAGVAGQNVDALN